MPITLPPISRRGFLKGSFAAAGALLARPHPAWPQTAPVVDPNRLALLSDVHIEANRELLARDINMWKQFQQVSDEVLALGPRPASLLINGDCAFNRGKPDDYATLLDALKPMRSAGFPIHLALGNHDDRANLLAACGDDENRVADLLDRCAMRLRLATVDLYMLDSLRKTLETPGELGSQQIAWLKQSLDAGADRPAIVMLHHQPDDRPAEKRSGLVDTESLLEILLPRKQVKALFFGHTHVWKHDQRDGLHFVNLPTTAYVFKPEQPAGWVDCQLAAGGMKLQLHALDRQHPKHGEVLDLAWR